MFIMKIRGWHSLYFDIPQIARIADGTKVSSSQERYVIIAVDELLPADVSLPFVTCTNEDHVNTN